MKNDDQCVIETGTPIINKEEMTQSIEGKPIWVLTTKLPWYDQQGNIIGLFGISREITERKNAEQSLKEALMKAKKADYLKSAFLANMSHEIRTPLNPILAYTDLMLDDELSDEHKEYLKTIKESVNLLLSIINDILDLSKIEAGQIEIEQIPVSLETIFNTINSNFQTLILHKGKDITIRESLPQNISKFIKSDPTRIQQILNNLH